MLFRSMPLHSPHLAHVPPPHAVQHSMSVLTTGQLPPLPSPGSHGQRRHARPKYGRQHTSSPTILHTVQPNGQVIGMLSRSNVEGYADTTRKTTTDERRHTHCSSAAYASASRTQRSQNIHHPTESHHLSSSRSEIEEEKEPRYCSVSQW